MRPLTVVVPYAVVALVLAGCGSIVGEAVEEEPLRCPPGSDCYDPPTPIGPGSQLTVASPGFFFVIEEGFAVDGPVEVTLRNTHETLHNFRIDEAAGDVKKVEAAGGATETGTLLLFGPGEYTFFCDVPGHRAAGMEGTLEVFETLEQAQEAGAGDGTETPTDGETPTGDETPADGGTSPEPASPSPTGTETETG